MSLQAKATALGKSVPQTAVLLNTDQAVSDEKGCRAPKWTL